MSGEQAQWTCYGRGLPCFSLSLCPKRSVDFKLGYTLKLPGGLFKNIPSQLNVLTLGNV